MSNDTNTSLQRLNGLIQRRPQLSISVPPFITPSREPSSCESKYPTHFGRPTKMQLEMLEAAMAQNWSVTRTEKFKQLSTLMKCYAVQGAAVVPSAFVADEKPRLGWWGRRARSE